MYGPFALSAAGAKARRRTLTAAIRYRCEGVRTRRMSVRHDRAFAMRHRIRSGLFPGALVAGALALGSPLAIAPTPAATDANAPRCVAPADLTRLDLPLRRTARRLAARRFVVIVALGSSSTAGAGASSAEATYPSRLMAEL